jgi:hypothetical protein
MYFASSTVSSGMSIVVVIFMIMALQRAAMSVINAMNNAIQYTEFQGGHSQKPKFSTTAELL